MKAKRVRKLDPDGPLLDNAARIVATRLGEVRALGSTALDGDAAGDHHDLRIAAKRLRYVLELFGDRFGDDADAARRAAREIQDVLGDLHDCDVLLPRIAERVAALRADDARAIRELAGATTALDPALAAAAPHRATYRGLEVLSASVAARRDLLAARFAELWAELEEREVWERLDRAVERSVGQARERREAEGRARKAARRLERAVREQSAASERATRAAEELDRARSERDRLGGGEPVEPPQ